jgi:G-patch domain
MSFGQKILEKYGYKTGAGLGKNENGIIEPIKANYKVNSQNNVALKIETIFLYFFILV